MTKSQQPSSIIERLEMACKNFPLKKQKKSMQSQALAKVIIEEPFGNGLVIGCDPKKKIFRVACFPFVRFGTTFHPIWKDIRYQEIRSLDTEFVPQKLEDYAVKHELYTPPQKKMWFWSQWFRR